MGAVTALLFAPKSGRELRQDITDTTHDICDKATDFVNDNKHRAEQIVNTVKDQASSFFKDVANDFFDDDKTKVVTSTDSVQQRFESLKEAAKAGAEAFKSEINK